MSDWLAVDAGYTHIFVDDSELNLSAAAPGNAARGNLSGDYENGIDIFTLQGRIRF